MTGSKLFISHASADSALVTDFVHQLLEGAIGVSPHDVFCSSIKGQGIRPGADFKASIKEHLDDATCVIALISRNFYSSAFCMCELGGTWMQAKRILPILVPPLAFSDLRAVLSDTQSLRLSSKEDLDQLRDELGQLLGLKQLSTSRWNDRRDAFLANLPGVLATIPDRTPVPRSEFEALQHEFDLTRQSHGKLRDELHAAEQRIEALAKLKDAAGAAAVLRDSSPVEEQFAQLTLATTRTLEPLAGAIREAFYYRTRKEDYDITEKVDRDELRRFFEHGLLEKDRGRWNRYILCLEDPDVSAAAKSLDTLDAWLRKAPAAFVEWYRATFGRKPDITLRPFWDRHLLDFTRLNPPQEYAWRDNEDAF